MALATGTSTPGTDTRLVPETPNPLSDFVEDERDDITMVARPRPILVRRCGGGWWMEMVPNIVGIHLC